MGDVLSVTVGTQTTGYEYDLLGRVTTVVNPDGSRTEAEYDALGNLTTEIDALGNETKYAYTVDSLLEAAAQGRIFDEDIGYLQTGNVEGFAGSSTDYVILLVLLTQTCKNRLRVISPDEITVNFITYGNYTMLKADIAYLLQFSACPDTAYGVMR